MKTPIPSPAAALEHPLLFQPLLQPRVWGGRLLETAFGRLLPDDGLPYGESWELCDRPEAQTVVVGGPLAGCTLHDLWTSPAWSEAIFGPPPPEGRAGRFPLLVKILDARDTLSLQVHPPADVASTLGGEPKTEMWYIAAAEPGAALHAGFARAVTPEEFRLALADGSASSLVARLEPKPGDSLFIPSGRIHAIGAGLLIFEIQQNSDTTYRVYDWDRVGLDGQPRTLHLEPALKSIDFQDVAPPLQKPGGSLLVDCPCFRVGRWTGEAGQSLLPGRVGEPALLTVVSGSVVWSQEHPSPPQGPGTFALFPACLTTEQRTLVAESQGAEVLVTTWPG